MATLFDDSDIEYLAWLAAHPEGFVMNTGRGITPNYRRIHRAGCYTIQVYTGQASAGGFTERQYVKICADSIEELHEWLRNPGHVDGPEPSLCRLCHPS